MADLNSLLGELRNQGTLHSTGRFTLDPVRLRDKLRCFGLSNPYQYVLKLAQWAVGARASFIDLRRAREGIVFRHDGLACSADDLYRLMSGEGGVTDLMLAVSGVLFWKGSRFCLTSGGLRLTLSHAECFLETVEEAGTVVVVRRPNRGLIARYVDSWFDSEAGLEEPAILCRRGAYCPLELRLEGSNPTCQGFLPTNTVTVRMDENQDPGSDYWTLQMPNLLEARQPADPDKPSIRLLPCSAREMFVGEDLATGHPGEIVQWAVSQGVDVHVRGRAWLVVRGIVVEERGLDEPGISIVAVADHLETDFTGLNLVKGRDYNLYLKSLVSVGRKLAAKLKRDQREPDISRAVAYAVTGKRNCCVCALCDS